MTENVSLPEQNVLNNDDTAPNASNSDVSNSIIHIDKDELLDKLYKLNEDNLLLSEQLKQYRVMVQTLENKLTELNNAQNKKHQQITDTLLKNLAQKKAKLKSGSLAKTCEGKRSKHSKRSKERSKRSKRSKNKHSTRKHSKR